MTKKIETARIPLKQLPPLKILLFALCLLTPLILQSAPSGADTDPSTLQPPKFYRIIDGPNPGPEQAAIDRYLYGTDVLYTGDATMKPTFMGGTVWHADLNEAQYFLGTHNPVIEQRSLLKLIEDNKWEEAKILMRHVPNAFPKTENMAEILTGLKLNLDKTDPAAAMRLVYDLLLKRYPQGFFLKSIGGFDSSGTFPTEKTDFTAILEGFMREIKPRVDEILRNNGTTDDIHFELKSKKFYEGRILNALFNEPGSVIVQEKLRPAFGSSIVTKDGIKTLIEEYRVHIAEGQVISGATQHRWDDARIRSSKKINAVENFARRVIKFLPPEMQKMCFGMDIMRTANGLFKIIELNTGGESGYLYPETDLWDTHLLASHYRGKPTELIQEVMKLESATTSLAEKEKILDTLLARKEIKAVIAQEPESISEILYRAKTAFLDKLHFEANPEKTMEVMSLVRKFKLQPYLSNLDIELFANHATQGKQLSLPEICFLLDLNPHEHLLRTPSGEISLLSLNYNDIFVTKKLAKTIGGKISAQDVTKTEDATLRKLIRKEIDETVLTRRQLRLRPELLPKVLRNEKGPLTLDSRFLYGGSKQTLVEMIFRELRRLHIR